MAAIGAPPFPRSQSIERSQQRLAPAGAIRTLPQSLRLACQRNHVAFTRFVLLVSVERQQMDWVEVCAASRRVARLRRRFLISTSRFGIGQAANSNQTPLGLHRVARKIGGGWPIGTVFIHREAVGLTWDGHPDAAIAHRILWLEGLEPGHNAGGQVDTFHRYVYIHGVGDETTLGHPASRGCVHLSAHDLLMLYDAVPAGTLVWIEVNNFSNFA